MARGMQEPNTSIIKRITESHQKAIEISEATPNLPTELWLQILEHDDIKHLWLSVRKVSRMYRDLVERLFTSRYLNKVRIALSLPRRDPETSRLKWPGDPIPGAQLVMAYTRLNEDKKQIRLESSPVVKDRNGEKTLEELRQIGTLPKARLEEAPANVNMSTHPMAGLAIKLPVRVDWDEMRKIWVWEMEWRSLLSRFFDAKDRQGKRWPTTIRDDTVPRESQRHGNQACLA